MRTMTGLAALLVLILIGCCDGGAGEKVLAVQAKFQPLWPKGAPGAKGTEPGDIPGITVHLASPDKTSGAAVVICPGGGYGFLAEDHEGTQVARWLNSIGVAGIVLKYRLGPKYHHPTQLHDAQRALRFTRAHAREWGLDPAKVGIMGFSAGGHLASTAGTHFDTGSSDVDDPIDSLSNRPDFMILCYPVIQMTGPYAHGGSRNNLLGKGASDELAKRLSNETQVTAKTPPTFLMHTTEDTGVPPENSVLFYLALTKNKVPAELHIYEKGRHGLGMGGQELPYASWTQRCAAWMRGRGLYAKE